MMCNKNENNDKSGSNLFHIADEGMNVQAFAFCIDGVESAHQIFQENIKGLGQAEHCFSVDIERGDFLPVKIHHLAGVCRGVVGRHHVVRRTPIVMPCKRVGGVKRAIFARRLQKGDFRGSDLKK